jgi:hypothetical protein
MPAADHASLAPRIADAIGSAVKASARAAAKPTKPAKPVAALASPFAPKTLGKLGAKLYGGSR